MVLFRKTIMTDVGHLWAVGFDDIRRAEQVRDEITRLSVTHCLVVRGSAVSVRYADGSFTVDGEPYVPAADIRGRGLASLLVRLALGAPPLTSAAVGFTLRSAGCTGAAAISDEFI